MQLLLHACCGPCTCGVLPALQREGIQPALYWNNPNIHPFTEYKCRLGSLKQLAEEMHIPLIIDGAYGLREFTAAVSEEPDARCTHCYKTRLRRAAEHAAANGFDAFSTTLLVSPHQRHDLIRAIGEKEAKRAGIDFLYRDFRPGFRDGQDTARSAGLYMQKYCGCIYSEEERYASKNAKLPSGFFANFPAPPPESKKKSRRALGKAAGSLAE